LEAIDEELENPFGNTQNDLALDDMSANIERSISEIEDILFKKQGQGSSHFIT
jgi:putative membrane protein